MWRLLFRPLIFVLLILCTTVAEAVNAPSGVRVIVIDAGHGGPKYPGAHYQGVYEKDLNLQVALRLGELIEQNLPEVKVVYTRKSDKQFSESLTKDLQARADIANNAGGDLFISIHTNAARSTAARGVETLIMGESSLEHRINDEVLFANNKEEFIDMSDQRTAAVVRAYIANLRFTYGEYSEAMGRLLSKSYKAAGRHVRGVKPQLLKVLYATNMPSVLTEIGFMSNPEELRYMNSDRGQREIARSIFAAVKEYVALVRSIQQTDDTTVSTPAENSTEEILSVADTAITSTSEAQAANEDQKAKNNDDVLQQGYTIQILASGSQLKSSDSQFKSYRGKVVELLSTGRYRYKYCVGRYATQTEAKQALAEVKQQFSDAYIIRFEGNEVAR